MSGLPAHVDIREVGPRDGFQNEPETIATGDKIDLINRLARTGLRRIEIRIADATLHVSALRRRWQSLKRHLRRLRIDHDHHPRR